MNDWYDLTNNLDTDIPPLDEVSRTRIEQRVRSALPRRRKRRALLAVIAAVLVLSACGYAVATGQFSDWFWNKSADPKAPETSEDLLASMGTVIGQSQTVDGVTMTLNGALWDGTTIMLSLSLEGEEVPANYWTSVHTEDSWFRPSKEQTRTYLETSFPYMTDEELDEYLEEYWQNTQFWFRPREIIYLCNRQTETFSLQIESDMPFSGDTQELILHLENLDIQGETIQGPFEFTFTVERHDVELVYFGEVDMEPVAGIPIRVTKVSISPFRVKVRFTGLEKMELDANGEIIWNDGLELSMDALRIAGEEVTGFTGRGSTSRSAGPDGSWDGSVSRGPLDHVIDPATVEAVKINDTWLELNDFTLAEPAEK